MDRKTLELKYKDGKFCPSYDCESHCVPMHTENDLCLKCGEELALVADFLNDSECWL